MRELQKGGYDPLYERIETPDAMKKALREKSWDIILCDYKMPKFSAPAAIALFKKSGIDIPFVVISGTIGEDTAVECMRSGAHDYFMKGKLSRLCSAIERELGDVNARMKQKQAEEALKHSEAQYRLLADNVTDVIFTTDMELNFTYISPSVCQLIGYMPEELMTMKALDILIPETSGNMTDIFNEELEVEKRDDKDVKRSRVLEYQNRCKDGSTIWVETTITFLRDEHRNVLGVLGCARNISARKRTEMALAESFEKLNQSFGVTIKVLISALEMRDPYTAGHQSRVAHIASAIAREMGLDEDRIEGLKMAGTIHDIGKLSIPAEILSKPSRLTALEFRLIQEHPRSGYDMLKDIESPWPLAEMVHQHHERIDGSGYPEKLKGDEILLEARILAVADVVEAMASHRPYRASLGIDAALDEIEKNRGILFDEEVAEACLKLFREKGYQLV
jgi:PAS domain S-box-containing protein